MKARRILIFSCVALVLIVLKFILFQVDETEFVVVTQFGRPVEEIKDPGLNWKLPEPVQTLRRFNNRLRLYNIQQKEYLTRDKKNIIVECYVTWKINEPIKFMKTVKNEVGAQALMVDIVSSELGVSLGRYDLSSLVTIDETGMILPSVVDEIKKISAKKIKEYGMRISDVRIKLLNFPESNKESVFRRMKAERERIARKYRSEGTAEAQKIRAEAEKKRTITLSESYRKAEEIKGEGDAEAIKIYAKAFGNDPEFYQFIRSLESYEKIIDEKTTVILPSNSRLLKYFYQFEKNK